MSVEIGNKLQTSIEKSQEHLTRWPLTFVIDSYVVLIWAEPDVTPVVFNHLMLIPKI